MIFFTSSNFEKCQSFNLQKEGERVPKIGIFCRLLLYDLNETH